MSSNIFPSTSIILFWMIRKATAGILNSKVEKTSFNSSINNTSSVSFLGHRTHFRQNPDKRRLYGLYIISSRQVHLS
ncbi:hypothetical protein MKW98_014791 [Papaver atlanticum]|uniref:Secreted protein n=1 Tax=Papaver atlanticum TaxID=357466 RepID=A0AAD4SGB4_9MAGN|nr:hypothetical protein MKW98_014791 [Papaver atlanticum]